MVCTYTKHPKHSFSWPELESGQNEIQSGQSGPQLGNMFEKWTKFSRIIMLTLLSMDYPSQLSTTVVWKVRMCCITF